jgi:hypothetical protein
MKGYQSQCAGGVAVVVGFKTFAVSLATDVSRVIGVFIKIVV